jgi:hypothetical protein
MAHKKRNDAWVEYIQPLRFQFMYFMQSALKNYDISQYAYRV